ncbi:MAG: hypothetical protein JOZ62_09555 [Acidobacteriaceae bacterium]|nr:hypothetical protein [Acidobacteriaceae bacterium]
MIDVVLFQQLFEPQVLRFALEVKSGKKIVGSVAPNPNVDPTTGLVTLESGTAIKIPLRMEDSFEGEFTVAAVDPVTGITFGNPLVLRTDYVD